MVSGRQCTGIGLTEWLDDIFHLILPDEMEAHYLHVVGESCVGLVVVSSGVPELADRRCLNHGIEEASQCLDPFLEDSQTLVAHCRLEIAWQDDSLREFSVVPDELLVVGHPSFAKLTKHGRRASMVTNSNEELAFQYDAFVGNGAERRTRTKHSVPTSRNADTASSISSNKDINPVIGGYSCTSTGRIHARNLDTHHHEG